MPQRTCPIVGYAESKERSQGVRPKNEVCVLSSPIEAWNL